MSITMIGLDIAKSVFQVHAVDDAGQVVIRRKLLRSELLSFLLPRSLPIAALGAKPGMMRYVDAISLARVCVALAKRSVSLVPPSANMHVPRPSPSACSAHWRQASSIRICRISRCG